MGMVTNAFTTAAHVLHQREQLCLISTGCKDLDSILEGERLVLWAELDCAICILHIQLFMQTRWL